MTAHAHQLLRALDPPRPLVMIPQEVSPEQALADALAAIEYAGLPANVGVWLDDQLDDRLAPDESWIHVTTTWQAIELIDRLQGITRISLDNDLGDDRVYGQGKDVVDFICEQQFREDRDLWPAGSLILHTANGSARESMTRSILAFAEQLGSVRVQPRGSKRVFLFTREGA